VDNGAASSFVPFPSPDRKVFTRWCLVIVRAEDGPPATIALTASADGLRSEKGASKTMAVH